MAFSEETRLKIFKRAHGKCEKCKKALQLGHYDVKEPGAWHAHHLISPLRSSGNDNPSNGIALCMDCHKKTHVYGRRKT